MLVEWLHVLEYLTASALFAVLIQLSGYAVFGLFPRRSDLGETRPLATWILGFGIWICIVFALAAIGLLHRASLLLALIGLCGLLAMQRRRSRRGDTEKSPEERESPAESEFRFPRPTTILLTGLVAALLAPFFLLALTPVVSADASVYHLTVPKLYLEAGGFRAIEMNVYSNWPLAAEMIFALALAFKGFILAKTTHFLFGVLVLYALRVACRQTGLRDSTAWIAMVLFLANDVVGYELRVAYVELAHAFFLLAGFVFVLRALDEGLDSQTGGSSLLLAGISAGLLAGVKITAIVDAAILGLLLLPPILLVRDGTAAVKLRSVALRFALPVFLLWIPWILRSWLTVGNPVYPLLYDVFGGPDWNPALGEQFQTWQESIGMGRTPRDYLLLPLRVILLGGRGYDRFDGEIALFWLVAIPFAVIFGLRRAPARRALFVVGLHFLFWANSSQQIRFLVPILPLLAFSVIVPVSELLDQLPKGRRLAAGALLMLTLVPYVRTHDEILRRTPRQLAALRHAPPDVEKSARPEIFQRIDEELPADAKLLLVNHNQGFFCEREYLADSFFEASQIADFLRDAATSEEVFTRLRDRGVTHVMLDRRPLGISYPDAFQQLLGDPRRTQRIIASQDGRFLVFELMSDAENFSLKSGNTARGVE